MQLKNYNVYFFFAILIGVTILAYFLVQPFLVSFLVAAIIAHLFGFLYEFFMRISRNRAGLSSGLACLTVAILILAPIVSVFALLFNEIQSLLAYLSENSEKLRPLIGKILQEASIIPGFPVLDLQNVISQDNIIQALKSVSQQAIQILQGTYQGVAHFFFASFIMFFSLFYLFIDGKRLVKKIMAISPLKDAYEEILIRKFNSISRATLKGTSLIAIVQGTLGALLFTLTGVPSPVFLGILMMISSIIPSVGSGLVWLPVGVVMILAGRTFEGVIILAIGALIIGTVDNILRPKLVGKDTQMHPLLILFSTLGGISLFGISGFIIGPIIMSLFVALWEIYSLEFKSQLESFNK